MDLDTRISNKEKFRSTITFMRNDMRIFDEIAKGKGISRNALIVLLISEYISQKKSSVNKLDINI